MNGLSSSVGEPWNYLSRLLCKNILPAAYRTPATAEKLAVEVGVALPYMEEELENLVAATLMKKTAAGMKPTFSSSAPRHSCDQCAGTQGDMEKTKTAPAGMRDISLMKI